MDIDAARQKKYDIKEIFPILHQIKLHLPQTRPS